MHRYCRDCGCDTRGRGGTRHRLSVDALFLGGSGSLCSACAVAQEKAEANREAQLATAGFTIEHISQARDSWWLGGRWHVHRDGQCYAAHSYRESAVADTDTNRPGWTCPATLED